MLEIDLKRDKKLTPQDYLMYILIIVLVFLFLGLILQLSWNASMPLAFNGAKEISYITALLLIIVTGILFGRKM